MTQSDRHNNKKENIADEIYLKQEIKMETYVADRRANEKIFPAVWKDLTC